MKFSVDVDLIKSLHYTRGIFYKSVQCEQRVLLPQHALKIVLSAVEKKILN